jgi:hypothetical protein
MGKTIMDRRSLFANFLPLIFGEDRYVIYLPRFMTDYYPLIREILVEEPLIREINFIPDEKISITRKRGLDLLFSLQFRDQDLLKRSHPDLFELSVVCAALHWAHYFKLTRERFEVGSLIELAQGFDDLSGEIKKIVQEGFSDLWPQRCESSGKRVAKEIVPPEIPGRKSRLGHRPATPK